ncbi:hypothetical protein KYC5002_47975 [Archangium violaceum]|uniref:hypothetical protein n=1 Tax=Archangium violaceum TaxID=83451 RepID=UPI002B2C5DF3|nr:hypothetical protein KYC5002_47975 [Archangium gephyra]
MKSTCGALLLTLAVGCGPVDGEAPAPPPDVGTSIQGLEDDNGLTMNGLTMNGLAFNGLAFNGLAFNGLANSAFTSWFQQGPLTTSLFMKYLVRCAVPAGQSRTFADGGFTYTWPGSLGLAPGWSGGAPASVEEQQVVTACVAALVNKFGRTVGVSVLGANAQGQLIPYTDTELSDYSVREACFFGNMFNDEGFFVGNDQAPLAPSQSSLRACALEGSTECPPLVHIGSCQASCTLDPTGTYYTRCTRGGRSYRPITTRLRTQDVVVCGDGICQFTESCGSSNRYDDCALDCGPCR